MTGPGAITGSTAVGGALRQERRAYDADGEQPIAGYLAAVAAYLGITGLLAAVARRTGRPLPEPGPWDVLLTAGAVHRLSRLVAKDPVTSPFRVPFTRFRGQGGPAELAEEARGTGARRVVGELITCPFCTGLWIATGLTGAAVLAPGPTRLVCSGLTALTVADLLHFVRVGLQKATD
ncbi:DUF1360 domain-containing protein [Kitasatospora sp. A2-31]|uniref:DUF1360 domain-containing protein n=1 Tax=Kitasatospora sp. A2-31 TaxID=2916414 RepID=UPI001EEAE524|nr:DUF1360 domain-containing protein [Kitasatospora sp. A2-31]MCG6495657.1 DUF1360 domain-containing protein [Kitasatospora sp. A2-31]